MVVGRSRAKGSDVEGYFLRRLEPTDDNIAACAAAIRRGELVVMPTETVYGLAADATNPAAVRATFAAKGRPADHPLIVHVSSINQAKALVREWPNVSDDYAARFWPGPLTLVVYKSTTVDLAVTGGQETVAIRLPAHPVAQALIAAVGRPLTAPSANRFTRLSATRAEDVDPEIAEKCFAVLDGGPCQVGLESTILDLTGQVPRVLRPGQITQAELDAVYGEAPESRMPGSHPKHYSPKTKLVLVDELGDRPGLCLGPATAAQISLGTDPDGAASQLYAALHELDRMGHETIFAEIPPAGPTWDAIRDRLKRAAESDL